LVFAAIRLAGGGPKAGPWRKLSPAQDHAGHRRLRRHAVPYPPLGGVIVITAGAILLMELTAHRSESGWRW